MTEQSRVGFIGLGLMGKPMSRNLLKAGFPLTVFNRSRGKMEELAKEGARPAASPADLAGASEVVVSCLPGPADVEKVYLGPDGVLEGAARGTLLVEMSTIDPGTHQRLAAAAGERGLEYLDAPVTGGTYGAERGTLTIIVGGDAATLERARPVLSAMGERIYHMGPVGAGATAKLVNNMMSAINVMAFTEGMVLGTKAGLDPEQLFDMLSNGSSSSWQLKAALPSILKRDFEPGFTTALMKKDVNLAVDFGRTMGVRLLVTALVSQLLQEAQSAGLGDRSFYSVIQVLERYAGVEVKKP